MRVIFCLASFVMLRADEKEKRIPDTIIKKFKSILKIRKML